MLDWLLVGQAKGHAVAGVAGNRAVHVSVSPLQAAALAALLQVPSSSQWSTAGFKGWPQITCQVFVAMRYL
jgi:septum formation inhibitor MinC